MTAGRRDQLTTALPETLGPVGLRRPAIPALGVDASVTGYGVELLDALLPAVDRMIRQAQAEALQDAAEDTERRSIAFGDESERVQEVDVREWLAGKAAAYGYTAMRLSRRAAALTTDQAGVTDPHAGAEAAQDGIDRANRYTDTPDPGTTAERR